MGNNAAKQRRSLSEEADPSHLLQGNDVDVVSTRPKATFMTCCSAEPDSADIEARAYAQMQRNLRVERERRKRRASRVTMLIVGAEGVGKSQLARLLETETVGGKIPSERDLCSINMHHIQKQIRRVRLTSSGKIHHSRQRKKYDIFIWDTPGCRDTRAAALTYAHSVDAVVVVYNPSVEGSGYAAARQWVPDLVAVQNQRQRRAAPGPEASDNAERGDEDGDEETGSDDTVRTQDNEFVSPTALPLIIFLRNDAMRLARPNRAPTPATDEDRHILEAAKKIKTRRVACLSLLPFPGALEKGDVQDDEQRATTLRQANRLLSLTCQAVTIEKSRAHNERRVSIRT